MVNKSYLEREGLNVMILQCMEMLETNFGVLEYGGLMDIESCIALTFELCIALTFLMLVLNVECI